MEVFGYFAAAILLVTILTQMKTQWVRGTTKGVSRWLFIGQLLASVGFTIHSAAIGSTQCGSGLARPLRAWTSTGRPREYSPARPLTLREELS